MPQGWHRAQMPKGSSTLYIAHLLSVAALVFEAGGFEDEAIAALMHDAIEDRRWGKLFWRSSAPVY